MKEISLTQGYVAQVDDADFEAVSKYPWRVMINRRFKRGGFYALTNIVRDGKKTTIQMHRMILALLPGDKRCVDHIDHNGLNNQRSNLRVVTVAQNNQYQRKISTATNRLKGAHWEKSRGCWVARILVDGKHLNLGRFGSEQEAHKAYVAAAQKHRGQYVCTE